MNPINFALRRPLTIIVILLSLVMTAGVALRPKVVDQWLSSVGIDLPLKRMPVDIFPALNLPVIYVCQPYGGMDPAQMEGLLTNYYEYHFLYISGIHHVESKNVQGTALMKLYFHPGTNMSQAMSETINYVNRSRAMMPPGTVPPFVMRFDTGSVPVGYLVLSSETRTISEIQDIGLFHVRPMFAALKGVSAPPPFGGSARSIVLRVDPERLRAYSVSPDEVVTALTNGNSVSPSGNLRVGDLYRSVPSNAMVKDIKELGEIPIRTGSAPNVYLRDLGTIEDASDIVTGYSLVNGRRAVYILATKRAEASTMSVIDEIKSALPAMRKALPDDSIKISFEFDQSPYVTNAIGSLTTEGLLGACLTGLMVLLFLKDWRSVIVVVLNIPLAILIAVVGLWLCGHTINLMTLGGLALAVGILVDEATVEIENIHTQMKRSSSIAWAVRHGNAQTAVPRLLAMLCLLAVFVPSFFMEGAARELFVPLSLAVGFSMIASYLLSSTFVPVMCVWLLKPSATAQDSAPEDTETTSGFGRLVQSVVAARWIVVPTYLVVCLGISWVLAPRLGIEIFPTIDSGEFRLRLRAPDGTHIDRTEQYALDVLDLIKEKVGAENVALTLGYVGTVPASFPINSVYHFSRGPEEAMLRVALKPGSGVRTEVAKDELRALFAERLPKLRVSFEPADIISEVMSFGSPTPVEIVARGGSLPENRDFLKQVEAELCQHSALKDIQFAQSLAYPTVEVKIDRERAGLSGTTVNQITRSVVAATSSSRFVVPNYWPDPKSGIGYQVQVEIPQRQLQTLDDLGAVPIQRPQDQSQPLLLRDVAQLQNNTAPGQFDRYNMKRELSLTANISGSDLGHVAADVTKVLERVKRNDDAVKDELAKSGAKPGRVTYELRGQIPPLRLILSGLGVGFVLAVLVIFLMLSANFQSFRLALAAVSTAPAVVCGAMLSLWLTGSTLNIQSFIGAIMGIGVAMANAILLLTFAEQDRRGGHTAAEAAVVGASSRLRPILMTSCAMLAGMIPMALALGATGQQTAPLARAVIGSLIAATAATLLVLPAVFALFQSKASRATGSLDPTDPASPLFSNEE